MTDRSVELRQIRGNDMKNFSTCLKSSFMVRRLHCLHMSFIETTKSRPTCWLRQRLVVERFAAPPLNETERLVNEILTLPLSARHTAAAEIEAVVAAVREYFAA
jgi:dTDP-4-amino-4,6-dideoxygalactose transaminase